MTRRGFAVVLAGTGMFGLPRSFAAGESPRVVIFQAIAGARLPETLAIRMAVDGSSSSEKMLEGVWELRTYRIQQSCTAALAGEFGRIFPRNGIRPVLIRTDGPNLTYLIRFEHLAARDRAWTALNADPEWFSARPRFQSYHFGLYRAA